MFRKSLPLVALPLVASVGLSAGCGDDEQDFRSFTFTETIATVHVDVGTGSVIVDTTQSDQVLVEQTRIFSHIGPETRVSIEGDTLEIWARCSGGLGDCEVNYTVYVPASVTLNAEVGTGDLRVEGLTGPVDVAVGTGRVTGWELGGDTLEVATGTGDITVSAIAAPSLLVANTGTGNVDLTVPAGAYALDVSVGTGSVNVTGVTNDGTAANAISAHTGTGNVTVQGR